MKSYQPVPQTPNGAPSGDPAPSYAHGEDDDDHNDNDTVVSSDKDDLWRPLRQFFAPFLYILSPLETGFLGLVLFLEVLRGLSMPALLLVFSDFVNALHDLDDVRVLEKTTASGKAFAGFAVAVGLVYFGRAFLSDYVCNAAAIKYQKGFLYVLHMFSFFCAEENPCVN